MGASDPVFGIADERLFVLVFANEKGGTGKSTLSFHAIVSLLRCGYIVGSIDADVRQGTLSRYLENRAASDSEDQHLLMPDHVRLSAEGGPDDPGSATEAQAVLAGFADAVRQRLGICRVRCQYQSVICINQLVKRQL